MESHVNRITKSDFHLHHESSETKLELNESKITSMSVKCQKGFLDTFFHCHSNKDEEGTWSNWAQNQSCRPTKIFHPTCLNDLVEIVNKAREDNKQVRCVASGHSWSSSSVTDGYLVVVQKMNKIYAPKYSEKEQSWIVQVETGVTIKELDDFLRKHDPPLAMPSNVVLDSVRYGGLLSLGC
ncbi:hypothetical protein BGZ65_011279, partial [Modicella reniformis]